MNALFLPRGLLVLTLAGGLACGSSTPKNVSATADSTVLPSAAPISIGGCSAVQDGEDLQVTDVNNDGLPEVCKYYRKIDDPKRPGSKQTLLVRQVLDVNWDGKIDIKRIFGADGSVVREEWDADYDGNVDEVRLYEDGTIVRSDRDLDNDGRIEVVRYYAEGKLERKETDTNGDGQTDRWEYFKGRAVDRVGIDKDYDGKVDTWAKKPGLTPPS